jgi:hypothetical protein
MNDAVASLINKYPRATHIFYSDTYYLGQTKALRTLLEEYRRRGEECIIGAAVWCVDRSTLRPRVKYYDRWSSPELEHYRIPPDLMPKGVQRVSSVGACYIYPVHVWKEHRYGIPEPFPKAGIFHNWLCRKSGLPVYIDFDAILKRTYLDNPGLSTPRLQKRMLNTILDSVPIVNKEIILKLRKTIRRYSGLGGIQSNKVPA